ncbi:MAG: prepilin peptidase [Rickettsiales bacterium]|nr:prepilin peptidase [Rickettsiales bacterium]
MNFFSTFNLQLSNATEIFLITIFGLIFGSCATFLSYRLAIKKPIIFVHSNCPKCNFQLKAKNLIPVFSYLFQGGKCSNCHEKISLRYPLIEIITTIFFIIIYFSLDKKIDQRLIIISLIAFTLIVMSITDLEHYFIPDSLQYFLAILAIILRINDGGVFGASNNISAAFLYSGFGLLLLGFFYIVTKIEAIGVDDIKFFFIAGLLLGLKNFLFFMMLSGFLGIIFGIIWQKFKRDKYFPFAPAICLALYICLLANGKFDPVKIFGSLIF